MKFEIYFRKNFSDNWTVKEFFGTEQDAVSFIRRLKEDGFEVVD